MVLKKFVSFTKRLIINQTTMLNKNIDEPIQVHLPKVKQKVQLRQQECLKMDGCECSVCKNGKVVVPENLEPVEKDDNLLEEFIKHFPSIFPLVLNPTTIYSNQKGHFTHYYNGSRQDNKNFLYRTKVSKLLTNHPMASNIRIYGSNFSKILAKHEVTAFTKRFQQKQSVINRKSYLSIISRYQQQTSNSLPSIQDHISTSWLNPEQRQSGNGSVLESKYHGAKILYIQAYANEIPFKVYYDKASIKDRLDDILLEYLDEQQETFNQEKTYTINEQFWQWVFNQYGQQVFAVFATEFYSRAYTFFSKNIIHKAIFYWTFEKAKNEFGSNTKVTQQLGRHKQMLEAQYFIAKAKKLAFRVKLTNVKNMGIEYHRNIKSFQEQYQEMILSKIKSSTEDNKVKNSKVSKNTKNYVYQSRLDTFHSKVRDLFFKEQNRVLNQVEKEKQFQGQEDSTKLAKLLLPNMGQYQTIRQILNDQFAFQKLILFQEKKTEKERIKKAREKLLLEKKRHLSNEKHPFTQSRVNNKQYVSRRIRVRTQF